MSNLSRAQLYEKFLESMQEVVVCPYCGELINNEQRYCCSEVHGEVVYDTGSEYISKDDIKTLDRFFADWLDQLEAKAETSAEDKYFSAYKNISD